MFVFVDFPSNTFFINYLKRDNSRLNAWCILIMLLLNLTKQKL